MIANNYDTTSVNLLPPDKRLPKFTAFIKALVRPLKWAYDLFVEYDEGTTAYPDWSSIGIFAKGTRAQRNHVIYESLKDGNINNPVTDTEWWLPVLANDIGINNIIKYNSQKIVLEWALNEWFRTSFAQPPSNSAIYTETAATEKMSFAVGGPKSKQGQLFSSRTNNPIWGDYYFGNDYNFKIYVPTSLYSSLENPEETIRGVVDRYNTVGIIYNIQTY